MFRPARNDSIASKAQPCRLLKAGSQFGNQFGRTWTLSAEIFNLLDRRDHDIDYAYEFRVLRVDAAATQIHFHPVEPIQARCALTARFQSAWENSSSLSVSP